ncbi:hypothetical protein I5Q34_07275 [Streptomyces sp. AV19]|uniref:hypothetical protein n=1 Tax=Streptomyces sp. AV19 TaxID=2793068 RepID=UPI0018FEDF30|nr:hypothetical protein [Streptomyces sp. AV19]MBH1934096.1 hypothetical protein [Streptomyces sp. AV19]MDG4537182.1 hypothetical protein [Streptomyces sp. AV19]
MTETFSSETRDDSAGEGAERGMRKCARDGCTNFFTPAATGRPRLYCSQVCRKKMWDATEAVKNDGREGGAPAATADTVEELVRLIAGASQLVGMLHRERQELDPMSVRAKVAKAEAEAVEAKARQNSLEASLSAAVESAEAAEEARAETERQADEDAHAAARRIEGADELAAEAERLRRAAQAERDDALETAAGFERDAKEARGVRDTALRGKRAAEEALEAERDRTRALEQERNQAREAAAAAKALQEAATDERDRAVEGLGKARKEHQDERDALLSEVQAAHHQRDEARREQKRTAELHATAERERAAIAAEHDALVREIEAVRQRLATAEELLKADQGDGKPEGNTAKRAAEDAAAEHIPGQMRVPMPGVEGAEAELIEAFVQGGRGLSRPAYQVLFDLQRALKSRSDLADLSGRRDAVLKLARQRRLRIPHGPEGERLRAALDAYAAAHAEPPHDAGSGE